MRVMIVVLPLLLGSILSMVLPRGEDDGRGVPAAFWWLVAVAALAQWGQTRLQASPDAWEPHVFALLDLGIAFLILRVAVSPRSTGAAVSVGAASTGIGIVLNALPVALLGAMPVSLPAARAAGVPPSLITEVAPGYIDAAEVPVVLVVFGDWIPVAAIGKVISLGDIGLVLGLAVVVAVVLRSAWSRVDRESVATTTSPSGREAGVCPPVITP